MIPDDITETGQQQVREKLSQTRRNVRFSLNSGTPSFLRGSKIQKLRPAAGWPPRHSEAGVAVLPPTKYQEGGSREPWVYVIALVSGTLHELAKKRGRPGASGGRVLILWTGAEQQATASVALAASARVLGTAEERAVKARESEGERDSSTIKLARLHVPLRRRDAWRAWGCPPRRVQVFYRPCGTQLGRKPLECHLFFWPQVCFS